MVMLTVEHYIIVYGQHYTTFRISIHIGWHLISWELICHLGTFLEELLNVVQTNLLLFLMALKHFLDVFVYLIFDIVFDYFFLRHPSKMVF